MTGRKSNTAEFISNANIIHNNLYDYSKTIYKFATEKVIIICKKHGEFTQRPNSHIVGKNGCPHCSTIRNINLKRKSIDDFVEQSNRIHNNQYDYSKVQYSNATTKVEIICPKHGSFFQSPDNHLHKQGCRKCSSTISTGEKIVMNILEELGYNYIVQKTFDHPSIKDLRYDFYIPNIRLLIEYDGVQHFKPVKRFRADTQDMDILAQDALEHQKLIDSLKTRYALRNNYRLLRLPYTLSSEECKSRITNEILSVENEIRWFGPSETPDYNNRPG
jgi:very-short-patch-repair endonuclease